MVQISQTEEDIKISIELNRLVTRKPDIVLLPLYIKFNSPPIFFERHLTKEIDEIASYCRVFKNEARIILVKKEKGIWEEVFQNLTRQELYQKRLEISDLIIQKNKERDQKALERFDQKRRAEVEKEIQRETAVRDRVKQFQDSVCKEALMVGTRKEAYSKASLNKPETISNTTTTQNNNNNNSNDNDKTSTPNFRQARLSTPVVRPMAAMRSSGKINFSFSNFTLPTPKRESQKGGVPFRYDDAPKPKPEVDPLDTVDE